MDDMAIRSDHVRSVSVHGSVPKWFRWTDSSLVQMGDKQFRMVKTIKLSH
jgi:hypothetical protein